VCSRFVIASVAGVSEPHFAALGQKQTWDCRSLMSALPPKADIAARRLNVRFVPIADSCRAANRSLFDDLVGGREQRRRHGKAEHPGGLMIDDQLELA
jgi:hypothetical protein